MKLKTLPQKLRARVTSSANSLAVQTTAFKASVVASSFKIRTQIGFFVSLKFFQDSVSLQSLTTLFLTKPNISDSITIQDVAAPILNKGLSDTGTFSDVFVGQQAKGFTDKVNIEDGSLYFLEDYCPENYTATVQPILLFGKPIANSIVINDQVALNLFTEFDKVVINTAVWADSQLLAVEKSIAVENLGLSDTGSIVIQDYCSPDYFAGDYVGIARTF